MVSDPLIKEGYVRFTLSFNGLTDELIDAFCGRARQKQMSVDVLQCRLL